MCFGRLSESPDTSTPMTPIARPLGIEQGHVMLDKFGQVVIIHLCLSWCAVLFVLGDDAATLEMPERMRVYMR